MSSSAKINGVRATASQQLRCSCHRLLAVVEAGRIVLKCTRCKRHAVVSLEGGQACDGIEVQFTD
ncbi:MAG: hypothetical protein JRI68_20995 [Deltaproteobacteria bacterium]|nr:hypothetical protein [Deltaproteobacteria bacterium]